MTFHFADLLGYGGLILRGIGLTILLTLIAIAGGLVLGVLGALGRRSGHAPVRIAVGAYVELIRNTPFIVQLFFVFFGLPRLGIRLGSLEAAVLAMIVNLGGYATEIVRAGLDGVGRGLWEAGASLGLSRWRTFRLVILIPALEKVYPSLASQFVIIMLGSSIVSQIAVPELTFAGSFIQSRTFLSFETYLTVGAIYLLLSIGLRRLSDLVARRLFRHRQVPA
ncbi:MULTISPECIES: amino acid ABC transporter permease [Inquilinus]|uniref:Polar amino acid transport system permease protein n=1 Tax=Inquilinus ginsengisoli TaxID=363840 RepID=A0ABU1JZV2_9PROT|nr:amino acid ABC transporter permease [Inquilinus ginsengisoli]MDR6294151.1 polar amino acid transport system permease protein [Inquilinus ginsengisoli]